MAEQDSDRSLGTLETGPAGIITNIARHISSCDKNVFVPTQYIALNAHGRSAAVKPGHSHASREKERVR